jgi:LemA protein
VAVLLVLAGLGLLLVLAFLLSFNRFVRQRQLIDNAWSNVNTELKRRYDLVPNLVTTVKAYAAHERQTLEAVIEARAAAVASNGGAAEQAASENVLVDALKQLLALRETYPELRANEHFADLQRQLILTEDRIQAARRFYNANVRDFNTRVESFPSSLVASVFGFEKADWFEIDHAIRDAGAPEVKL